MGPCLEGNGVMKTEPTLERRGWGTRCTQDSLSADAKVAPFAWGAQDKQGAATERGTMYRAPTTDAEKVGAIVALGPQLRHRRQ